MDTKHFINQDSKFLFDILASIGDGVIATDGEGKIIFLNEAAATITEWTATAAMGQSFDEVVGLFNAINNESMASPVTQCLMAGNAVGLEDHTVLVTPSGATKYLSANCAPILAETGDSGAVVVFRDVTSYKVLEQKSDDDESNLKKIFDAAPVAMLILDETAKLVQINNAALELVGTKKHQVLGKSFGDGFCCKGSFDDVCGCGFGEDCKNCDLRSSAMLAFEGTSISGIESQKTFIRPDQEVTLWLRANFAPLTVGGKTHLVVALVDITDQKNKEIAATEARDFYLGIFENLPLIVWRDDLDGSNNYSNGNWELLTGQTAEQARGYGWAECMPPEDLEEILRQPDGQHWIYEPRDGLVRVRHWSGEYRWIHSVSRLYHDLNGNPEGYIGMGIDITERKLAEEQIKSSQAEYQSLFMNMPSGFVYARIIFDEHGTGVDFEYLKVNETYEKMISISREDIIGKRFSEILPARLESNANRMALYGEVALGHKEKAEFEYYSETVGNWISMTIYSPTRGYIVKLVTDITERRLTQQAQERAIKEAEAAYRAKSEFLANMSHEIRTPINGINGMIDLTLLTGLTCEQKDNLITAKSCSQALLGIINDILDFSKMEAGKLTIDKVNFCCKDILAEVVKVHSPAAIIKGIGLSYSLSAGVPDILAGDPNRLRQVINNLINNAIKFTESGQVTVAAKSTRASNDRIELTVSVTDTGIGISAEAMEKLFKPFSQGDSSVTRRYGGTGLGLVISKQLVEMMGGSLWVESEKGNGSTFAFVVRFAPAIGAGEIGDDAKPHVENLPAPKTLSILLVEDDNVSRMVVQKYLGKLKHQVDSVADGQQAIELFAKKRYDAILMDIQMPVMDGVEATRRIREVEAGSDRHTPIIALTAHALAGDREKYLAAGMDEYISKPLQIGELQAKLERVTSIDVNLLRIITRAEANTAATVTQAEQAKIIDEIDSMNQMIDIYTADMTQFEGFVHRIKVLANMYGLEEIKTLAFKAELAARRDNIEEAVSYASRIRQIIETYRKTDILW